MKTKVIILNIVMIILILPTIILAVSTTMIHNPNIFTKIVIFFMFALPIVIIVTQIISWDAISKQNYSFALKINALPVLNVLIIIIITIIFSYFNVPQF